MILGNLYIGNVVIAANDWKDLDMGPYELTMDHSTDNHFHYSISESKW